MNSLGDIYSTTTLTLAPWIPGLSDIRSHSSARLSVLAAAKGQAKQLSQIQLALQRHSLWTHQYSKTPAAVWPRERNPDMTILERIGLAFPRLRNGCQPCLRVG
jgi:hypothetical protein